MRKVVALGAVVLLSGTVGVALAQERLQQSNPQGFGVGNSVGDVSGSSSRGQTFDRTAFLDRLSAPETVFGRVLAIDIPGGKLHLETGGSSHDEGRAGGGAMSSLTLFLDENSNADQLRVVGTGDDVAVLVVNETTARQTFSTGKKLVREVNVIRVNEKLSGFGGLGQRPNPRTERGIETNSGTVTGGPMGGLFPGALGKLGPSETTGAAPCWNCEPQPGWGYAGSNPSDYGNSGKPNLVKGLQ